RSSCAPWRRAVATSRPPLPLSPRSTRSSPGWCSVLSTPIRTTAPANVFIGELFRQPWLLFIVILGPFLILLAFVLGARVYRDFPTTIIVQPAGQPADAPLQMGAENLKNFLDVVDVTTDLAAALARLHLRAATLV